MSHGQAILSTFASSRVIHRIGHLRNGSICSRSSLMPISRRETRFEMRFELIDTVYKYLYTSLVSEKSIFWVASSLDDVRSFPEDARRLAGHFLHLVQQGLDPPDWKPMASVGQGVYEIRIHTRVEHRVLYLTKFSEGIYVLHAFRKKSRATSASDIDLARRRLKQLVGERGSHRGQQ